MPRFSYVILAATALVGASASPAAAGWSPARTVALAAGQVEDVRLAGNGRGVAVVSWSVGTNDDAPPAVQVVQRPRAGPFGPIETVSDPGVAGSEVETAVGPDGTVAMAWRLDGRTWRIAIRAPRGAFAFRTIAVGESHFGALIAGRGDLTFLYHDTRPDTRSRHETSNSSGDRLPRLIRWRAGGEPSAPVDLAGAPATALVAEPRPGGDLLVLRSRLSRTPNRADCPDLGTVTLDVARVRPDGRLWFSRELVRGRLRVVDEYDCDVGGPLGDADLVVDAAGNATAVWRYGTRVFAADVRASGLVIRRGVVFSGIRNARPHAAVSDRGHVVVATGRYARFRRPGGRFTSVQRMRLPRYFEDYGVLDVNDRGAAVRAVTRPDDVVLAAVRAPGRRFGPIRRLGRQAVTSGGGLGAVMERNGVAQVGFLRDDGMFRSRRIQVATYRP